MSAVTETSYGIEQQHEHTEASRLTLRWVLIGGIAGILGDLAYFLGATSLFDPRPTYYLGMAFGPLLALGFVGYYFFFRAHRLSPSMQVATLFGIIAGTIVNMMIVVQGALVLTFPPAARESIGAAWEGFNMVQLGLDVSWDIYISSATVLLAVAMWGHPRFHKVFAVVTGLLGVGLLVFNLWTYPIPPDSAGLVDLGPALGGWYFIVTLRVLTSRKWLAGQLAASERPAGGEEPA
jgi:hypothetical protein